MKASISIVTKIYLELSEGTEIASRETFDSLDNMKGNKKHGRKES